MSSLDAASSMMAHYVPRAHIVQCSSFGAQSCANGAKATVSSFRRITLGMPSVPAAPKSSGVSTLAATVSAMVSFCQICRRGRRISRHTNKCLHANPSRADLFGSPPRSHVHEFPEPDSRAPPNGKTAIVIGAGVGGLAIAGRLARAGFSVTLLEKNESAGGRMRSEIFNGDDLAGHRFDTGPSLLLFPEKYREAFAALGAVMEDHVQLARVEPTAMRVHYAEDATTLDLLYDAEAMRRQLEEVEPGAGQQYFRWLGDARASLDLGLKAFIEQDSTSALDFVDLTRVGPLALAVNPILLLGPQTWQLATHFSSNKIKALFSYQHLYVGLRPQNAPGVFSLLAATEITDGIWYPVGGFATVRDALVRLAEAHGVLTRYGSEVSAILVDENKAATKSDNQRRIKGVQLASGELLTADVVVANPDLPYVYESLLEGQYTGVEQEAKQICEDLEYSCSMIEFCWSLKAPLSELTQHNVFLSSDYEGSWDRPCTVADFRERDSFNFYVHRPLYTDSSAAPAGEDNVMIELPIGNELERAEAAKKAGLSAPESDDELVAAARDAMIRQFERMGYGKSTDGQSTDGGMASLIKGECVVKPSDWEKRYNVKHGAVFGLSHGLLQLACFRPPRQTGIPSLDAQKVEGLHFVGASTRPGNGVPLVLMGVAVAFDNIVAEQGVGAGPSQLPLAPMKSTHQHPAAVPKQTKQTTGVVKETVPSP